MKTNDATTVVCAQIEVERLRQMQKEGWSTLHDDDHENGSLASAAACYTNLAAEQASLPASQVGQGVPQSWPWGSEWWKPKDARRNLIRAAALIVAEVERIDRQKKVEAALASQVDRHMIP